jgi:toxin-antitoxin system, toxin component, PIN family
MKCDAVIDTNVLVSAALKLESVPGQILLAVFCGMIRPLLNEGIAAEYRDVLLRPKFHLTPSLVDEIVDGICAQGLWISAPALAIDLSDPNDRIFYEVLMERRKSGDAVLITGNIKHFPPEEYILTPRQMLDRLTE